MSEAGTRRPASDDGQVAPGAWVYAVAEAGSCGDLAGLTGVGGAPVTSIEAGGLEAMVSAVDLAEFGAEPLRRNMENLQWLEAVARAHHHVIEAASQGGPIVPMRLATVYLGTSRVAAMLLEHGADFRAALQRVTGRVEWGVKAYAAHRADASAADSLPASASARPGESSGAAYLRRRRTQLTADEDSRQAAAQSAERVHAELAHLAEASQLHRPQDPGLSGHSATMIMNATYLVRGRECDGFVRAVADLAEDSGAVQLELTGPWPPYSFATAPDTQAATQHGRSAI